MPNFAFDVAPALLGSQFLTMAPQYIALQAIMPQTRHDFNANRTKRVQFFQFDRWGARAWTKAQRRRDKLSVIGTANSEGLASKVFEMQIFENTGPATADTGAPSSLWITLEDMLFARANLMQEGMDGFHQSIGSRNLADDYNGFMDRCGINELMNTTVKLNPANKADAAVLVTDRAVSADLDRAVFNLTLRNTPAFPDGLYHAVCDLTYLFHLMGDTDFKQTAYALHQNAQVPVTAPMAHGLLPNMIRSTNAGSQVPTGMPGPGQQLSPLVPLLYKNVLVYPSNNIPKRVVNSLDASLCLVFGPNTVAYGSGGKGVQVKMHNDTDYQRHMRYIWSHWFDMIYMLSDNDSTGCAVELRSFGVV